MNAKSVTTSRNRPTRKEWDLKLWKEKHPGDNPEKYGFVNGKGIEQITSIANDALGSITELVGFAGKFRNDEAIRELYRVVAAGVSAFDELCHENPSVFAPLARKHSVWPGWITCDMDVQERNERLKNQLHLGIDHELNYGRKSWSRKTVGTFTALRLYGFVKTQRDGWIRRDEQAKLRRFNDAHLRQLGIPVGKYKSSHIEIPADSPAVARQDALDETFALAKSLEPLRKDNCENWLRASWPCFLAWWGKDFENHECFSKSWKSDSCLEPIPSAPGRKKLKRNARGLVRDAIKKSILAGFRSIAKESIK